MEEKTEILECQHFRKILNILFLIISISCFTQKNKEAYFASGCFWCVESIYENLNGVSEVQSGYSGGKTKNPDYYQVLTGKTGHAETVKVIYDSKKISFKKLVEVFFASHAPAKQKQTCLAPSESVHFMSPTHSNKSSLVRR